MIDLNAINNEEAEAPNRDAESTDNLFTDKKQEIKRKAAETAGDACYAANSIFSSIEDSTRRSPALALFVAAMVGVCISKRFYKKSL